MLRLTILSLFIVILTTNGQHEELCPVDCHCHSFRINWVTDCSESNLTSIPYGELSPNVYILDMNNNNIEHVLPFPADIKLRRLQIAHNRLTELTYESFRGLKYLLDADFSNNNIRRIDPDALQDSPGLITLELQNNPLDEVTDHFLDCLTLLYLDLSGCTINHLDINFFHHTTNLKTLDLSNNPLEAILEGPLNNLTNLAELKLNNCSLSNISGKAFMNLDNLLRLEIANNNLKAVNWIDILAPLVRLEHLDLARTGITHLPVDAFAKNLYLRELVLAHNELHHLDVVNTLGHNLHNLHTLDLSHCALEDRFSEEAFKNASKLKVLNLSGNPMFAGNLNLILRNLTTLHELSLSNCSLERLPTFGGLTHLKELDVSYNSLSHPFVANNTFPDLTALTKLILSGNKLRTLRNDLFAQMTNLKTLEMSYCDLEIPLDPNVFGTNRTYSTVTELKLSGNPLLIPQNGSLLPKQLSQVELLDLSYCNISFMNENIFSTNKNLTHLDLSGNKISSIESLAFLRKLRRLERLNLSYNNLVTINPKVFTTNSHLISLNLIGNPFVCNCSIRDMWDWAIKTNDLDILVGSQTSNFPTGGVKIRKFLACSYDNYAYPAINDQNQNDKRFFGRKGDFQPNRTWAKYIRESNCPKKM